MALNPGAALRQILWDDLVNQVSIVIVIEFHEMGEVACGKMIGLEFLDKSLASGTQLFAGRLEYFLVGRWLRRRIVFAHSIEFGKLLADLVD